MKDKLAIIVPYRDREEHLNVFIPHMHEFLKNKEIDYDIFVAEQSDTRPFNYGKLCNAVVKEIGEEYTYFSFHDIDMLPMNDDCEYEYPYEPTHLATNVEAHDNKLPYPQYFGGVILISREDFENANGYSNEYWGYGFEDLDLLYRLQRSGAYLEKFYDLNQTYNRYDENDILPYRIENVDISNSKKSHIIDYVNFDKDKYVYGPISNFTKKSISNNFFFSCWFNDTDLERIDKNIFSFEGCDTGVFLSNGKYIIAQIWDDSETHSEISFEYNKNKWNHIVFAVLGNKLILYINNIKNEIELKKDFKLYDYTNHCIKISDKESSVLISSVSLYGDVVSSEIVSDLYFYGNEVDNNIETKYGITPHNKYVFSKFYKNRIVLDSGKNLNHLPYVGNLVNNTTELVITSEIYLPIRYEGVYKSLVHDNDTDIIENYYEYNPDVEENADIFFNEVLVGYLDYKKIGLSNIKYKLMDIQNRNEYKLVRIVT